MSDQLLLEKKRLERLFDRFLKQIGPDVLFKDESRYRVHKVYNKKGKALRGWWEAYHFSDFVKHLVDEQSYETFTVNKIDDLLNAAGLGPYEKLHNLPSSGGFTYRTKKGERIFTIVANILDVHYLECYAQFLEFCIKNKLPLLSYNDNLDSPKIKSDIDSIRKYLKSLEEKENPQPRLIIPSINKESSFHYTQQEIKKPLGRDVEQQILREFTYQSVITEPDFSWLQLAGEAGQGKSRLAYELMLEVEALKTWAVGQFDADAYHEFVNEGGAWSAWQPYKPHLFVIDYVIGEQDWLSPFLKSLSIRSDFEQRVCVLLVERQRWDKGGFILPTNTKQQVDIDNKIFDSILDQSQYLDTDIYSDWFLTITGQATKTSDNFIKDFLAKRDKATNGFVELGKLENSEYLFEIVKAVVEANKAELKLSKKEVIKNLERIDSSKRPLFAYLYGNALAVEENSNKKIKTKEQLLSELLERHYLRRWKAKFTENSEDIQSYTTAYQLAVIATITRGLNLKEIQDKELLKIDDKVNYAYYAMLMNDTAPRTSVQHKGQGKIILPLQPDILGEWMVLDSLTESLSLKDTLNISWQYCPKQTAVFIQHLVQDFPKHPLTLEIIDFKQPDNVSRNYFALAAAPILSFMYKNDNETDFSLGLLEALRVAADKLSDPNAKCTLAWCYLTGKGFERSEENALKYYKQAAENGCIEAMLAIGFIYEKRNELKEYIYIGNDFYKESFPFIQDSYLRFNSDKEVDAAFSQAEFYFKKAADKGSADAQILLADLYLSIKERRDFRKLALKYVTLASEQDHPYADYILGTFYYYGSKVKKDSVRALQLFKKSYDGGYCQAKYYVDRISIALQLIGKYSNVSPYLCDEQIAYEKRPWTGDPPIKGNWKNYWDTETIEILKRVSIAIKKNNLYSNIENLICENVRYLELDFYPGLKLLDIQFLMRDTRETLFSSALFSDKSIAFVSSENCFINDVSFEILKLNTYVLTLKYLIFYTALNISYTNNSPVKILWNVDDIPFITNDNSKHSLKELVTSPELVNLREPITGRPTKISAFFLYKDELHNAEFFVYSTGFVVLENDRKLVSELNVKVSYYQGIFRTIPSDIQKG